MGRSEALVLIVGWGIGLSKGVAYGYDACFTCGEPMD
jgi:hypothetical protein